MIEPKDYTVMEIMRELHINASVKNPKQSINRKLDRLMIKYATEGQGKNLLYHITDTSNQDGFKLYCMDKFGCSPQKDFRKLRDIIYFALNDESFLSKPNTEKEDFLRKYGIDISRQTIKKNIELLINAKYLGGDEEKYLVVSKDKNNHHISKEISRELYIQGWKIYWKTREETGGDYIYAYYEMRIFLKGHPLKLSVPQKNAIMLNEINTLQKLIYISYLNELFPKV